jgi:hypothetical protein
MFRTVVCKLLSLAFKRRYQVYQITANGVVVRYSFEPVEKEDKC